MPELLLDKAADRKIKRFKRGKVRDAEARYKATKALFDKDHKDPKLDFKKHQSKPGYFKIKFLGKKDDGMRVILLPNEEKTVYYAVDINYHNEIDQKK